VGRVILTSSSAAISNTDLPAGRTHFDETVWTDDTFRTTTPYALSKTMAERAAWDMAKAHPGLALTTINPVLVAGPPLDAHYGTSLRVIERILRAKDPAMPPIAFGVVDVRDVAEAHVRALERPETAGERILVAEDTLWFRDIALALKAAFPSRRVVTRPAPPILLRIIGLFDPAVATVLPSVNRFERFDSGKARRLLGLDLIPAREAVVASARWMIEHGRA
jgi:dihydroflavonol-4-reductase